MSYTIEYARKVLKIPAGTVVPAGYGMTEHTLIEDDLFMFVKSGCNNIHPRPQTWHLAAWGWNYSVIQTVCERAGSTEGGGLKFQNGDTTPENYLKLYRKEIAGAEVFSIAALQTTIGIYAGYLCLGQRNRDEPWILRNLEEIKARFIDAGTWLDYQRYSISFNTIDDFRAFVHYAHIAERSGGFIGLDSIQNK